MSVKLPAQSLEMVASFTRKKTPYHDHSSHFQAQNRTREQVAGITSMLRNSIQSYSGGLILSL